MVLWRVATSGVMGKNGVVVAVALVGLFLFVAAAVVSMLQHLF